METSTNAAPLSPAASSPEEHRSIAPVWHTLLFLAVFFALSLMGARNAARGVRRAHILLYSVTIIMQWLYVAFIAWGLWLRGRKLRDIVGGRWNSAEAVITDVVTGICFNIGVQLTAALLLIAGRVKIEQHAKETQQVLQSIGPRDAKELLVFAALAVTAAICEEIMFRGYLQQQITAWTRSKLLGVVLAGLAFGAGHAYQGGFGMAMITGYGLLLGTLAVWRKSLRPGMVAHFWQDAMAGLLMRILGR